MEERKVVSMDSGSDAEKDLYVAPEMVELGSVVEFHGT